MVGGIQLFNSGCFNRGRPDAFCGGGMRSVLLLTCPERRGEGEGGGGEGRGGGGGGRGGGGGGQGGQGGGGGGEGGGGRGGGSII